MRHQLEILYETCNRRCYVHPDPIEFLYDYPRVEDREIAALICSCLAYGRVAQIVSSISRALSIMGDSPKRYICCARPESILEDFHGFCHRFATGQHLAALLIGVKRMVERDGSLYGGFMSGFRGDSDTTVLPALERFVRALTEDLPLAPEHLAPLPGKGSACKRWHLFLRWMVRKDRVDPGGWEQCPASALIVPVDTHMHRMGQKLNLTRRKQADLRTALEITEGFRKFAPEDPTKYDFALTRLGIRQDVTSPPHLFPI